MVGEVVATQSSGRSASRPVRGVLRALALHGSFAGASAKLLTWQRAENEDSVGRSPTRRNRADDGNRTRVLSLGSASRLNASHLRVGYLSCSAMVSSSAVVVRCCAVSHPVAHSSRHDLGTPLACPVGGQRGDEVVRPRNSVVDIGEYVEAVGCVGVDRWPARMRDDDWWPGVRVPGFEESGRDLGEGRPVDWFLLVEDLEIDEIVGAVVVAGSWVCRGAGPWSSVSPLPNR